MSNSWSPYALTYNPIKVGSIDGTDTYPHDHGIVRACSASFHPNVSKLKNPKLTLFVSRLDRSITEKDLEKVLFRVRKNRTVKETLGFCISGIYKIWRSKKCHCSKRHCYWFLKTLWFCCIQGCIWMWESKKKNTQNSFERKRNSCWFWIPANPFWLGSSKTRYESCYLFNFVFHFIITISLFLL